MSDPSVEGNQYAGFVFQRLLDEVYLLMDFISGRPDKSIAELQDIRVPPPTGAALPVPVVVPAAGAASAAPAPPAVPPVPADDIITHISLLRFPPQDSPPVTARNAAFLMLVKDRLNRMARPAIGMTIAYTAMVVGSVQEPVDGERPRAKRALTRRALAAEAYPGLIRSAMWLRYSLIAGIAALVLLTGFTAYTSGVAAYGKAMLERLDDMDRARESIRDSIKAIENARGAEASTPVDIGAAACGGAPCKPDLSKTFVRLCDRAAVLTWRYRQLGPLPDRAVVEQDKTVTREVQLFETPIQPQLCDKLDDANNKWEEAYRDLTRFEQRYLYLYRAPVAAAAWVADQARRVGDAIARLFGGAPSGVAERKPAPTESPQAIAATLSTFGTYMLSMCFTVLGAGVSILRDVYDKVRESTLSPRDLPLAWGRLALGLVAGAAIGLFYSPTQVPLQGAGGLTGTLSLSAQGLAFLAGYGVDSVFSVFDGLLRRLATAAAPPATNGARPG